MFKQNFATIAAGVFLIIAVAVGSYWRYSNLFHLGYLFDTVTTQYTWAKAAVDMGLLNMWHHYNLYLDYPIGNLWFVGMVERVGRWFGGGEYAFVTTLKVFYWIVDIALLATVYRILRQQHVTRWLQWCILGLVYLYPGLWFVSGVWGQSDTLHALLIVWSIQLFYSKKTLSQLAGGVLLALALFFKLQILLVVAVLVIMWFGKYRKLLLQRWKLLIIGVIALLPTALYGQLYLSRVYGSHPGLYNGYDNYAQYFSGGTILAGLAILLVPLYICVVFVSFSRIKDSLTKIHIFLAGFFGVVAGICSVTLGLNPLQFYRTMIEPLNNGAFYFSGSANLNNGITKLAMETNWTQFRWIQSAIVLSIFLYLLYKWFQAQSYQWKDTALYTLYSLAQFVLLYYVFSSGRVHSRYGHIAILILTILAPFLKLRRVQWLGLAGIFFFYVCNQIAVYMYQNPDNNWWYTNLGWLWPINSYYAVVIGMVISTLVYYWGYTQKRLILTEKVVHTTN